MLGSEYTILEKSIISKLAEIEEQDRNVCIGCGGEDCICCGIYLDRKEWKPAYELFGGEY